MTVVEGYDVIGDLHGHANELIKLLNHLGYQGSSTGYCHPSRKVVFLGDFIDRGAHLRQHNQLLDIVMNMVGKGHALAVMGNHEFNALAYHTEHEGDYLRLRNAKNTSQHQAFLNEFEFEDERREEILKFFYSLPLWLELDGLRVIHACWDQDSIDIMERLTPDRFLTRDLLIEASQKDSPAYKAIEVLLKGVEIDLPAGITFRDKDDHERAAVRVAWWNSKAQLLGEVALPKNVDIGKASKLPIPESVTRYDPSAPPCFIGHYWLSGKPAPLAHNVACLDYSVAKNGKLVAYRWSGEQQLNESNFTHVGA